MPLIDLESSITLVYIEFGPFWAKFWVILAPRAKVWKGILPQVVISGLSPSYLSISIIKTGIPSHLGQKNPAYCQFWHFGPTFWAKKTHFGPI